MFECSLREGGDITPVEDIDEPIKPSVSALLEGQNEGLLHQFRKVINLFRKEYGNGHLEQ